MKITRKKARPPFQEAAPIAVRAPAYGAAETAVAVH